MDFWSIAFVVRDNVLNDIFLIWYISQWLMWTVMAHPTDTCISNRTVTITWRSEVTCHGIRYFNTPSFFIRYVCRIYSNFPESDWNVSYAFYDTWGQCVEYFASDYCYFLKILPVLVLAFESALAWTSIIRAAASNVFQSIPQGHDLAWPHCLGCCAVLECEVSGHSRSHSPGLQRIAPKNIIWESVRHCWIIIIWNVATGAPYYDTLINAIWDKNMILWFRWVALLE